MNTLLGILFAIGAMLCWGFGDFFIQRTTRAVGNGKALFLIAITGSVLLFPFAYGQLGSLTGNHINLLLLLGAVTFLAAHFNFEAMRRGKISIIEPIMGLELPLTVGLSIALSAERISGLQFLCMIGVFVGIMLAATTDVRHLHYHRRLFERGVAIAGIAAVGMALTNYLVGFGSQQTSPIVTIWFSHSIIAILCGIHLIATGKWKTLAADIRHHPWITSAQSILDNGAWLFYGAAATMIPISIAMTISESYIVLAVLLGVLFNRERMQRHQWWGVSLAIVGILVLATITE